MLQSLEKEIMWLSGGVITEKSKIEKLNVGEYLMLIEQKLKKN